MILPGIREKNGSTLDKTHGQLSFASTGCGSEVWLCTTESFARASIVRLYKEYPDDYSPEIMFTYPLALILLGETEKAKVPLGKAKSAFPSVAKELKKERHPKQKSSIAGGITVGGPDQAYEYWKQYGKYWSNSEQAMSLL